MYWVKVAQEDSFSKEMDKLKSGKDINKCSKIKDLKPFLDENSLISVGRRLQQSEFRKLKHPVDFQNKMDHFSLYQGARCSSGRQLER